MTEGPLAVVTGGAGFLGSHLCERLLGEGRAVVAVDNLVTGDRRNLEPLQEHAGFRFLEQDVCEPIEIPQAVDRVYHLASPASPIDYQRIPLETLITGAEGTRQALELARRHGARYLQASTSECYGDPLEHPQKESYWGNVNPVGPRSCYDEAKRYGEALVMAYHRVHGMETRIVRIFNTYGPRMRLEDGRVVPALMARALRGEPLTVFGDGSQTRSFCYVDDLIDGIVRLMESEEVMPVNLGNPQELSILEFARAVLEVTGSDQEIRFQERPEDDPMVRRPDITRAREILGWEPRVSLHEGLERTLPYFRARVGEGAAS